MYEIVFSDWYTVNHEIGMNMLYVMTDQSVDIITFSNMVFC